MLPCGHGGAAVEKGDRASDEFSKSRITETVHQARADAVVKFGVLPTRILWTRKTPKTP